MQSKELLASTVFYPSLSLRLFSLPPSPPFPFRHLHVLSPPNTRPPSRPLLISQIRLQQSFLFPFLSFSFSFSPCEARVRTKVYGLVMSAPVPDGFNDPLKDLLQVAEDLRALSVRSFLLLSLSLSLRPAISLLSSP